MPQNSKNLYNINIYKLQKTQTNVKVWKNKNNKMLKFTL